MTVTSDRKDGAPGIALSRRSMVAALGVLATSAGGVTSRALAQVPPPMPPPPSDYVPPPMPIPPGGYVPPPMGSGGGQCFLEGTRLAVPGGEVPVEGLRPGDMVLTASGARRQAGFVGWFSVERDTSGRWPLAGLPVRVRRGALGAGLPARDLFVTGAHLLFLGGVLVPAEDLINGVSIAWADVAGERLRYFHVGLASHDVVLAEGLGCESLQVSDVARSAAGFDNGAELVAYYRGLRPGEMVACARVMAFNGGRAALRSRLRSALAVVRDVRDVRDRVRDEAEARLARAVGPVMGLVPA
ncbi:Hint domain-containing protein [Hyphomicrobium sp. CS1BSMeth3]|uniref:Hint domain-containing protein n=1 Tax=Hyphomicrobium sp. CS1BSMeth3 TaxID=1892844 RepID=UPI000931CE88|nr:Hint domain-containing protein [Hyphomicrobium sp. CS1BSMeth3]